MPETESTPIILTRYRVKVHASNRNADYGVPVEVYATSRREAVDRAIDVGWAGQRRDVRVTVLDIKQECHMPTTSTTTEAQR